MKDILESFKEVEDQLQRTEQRINDIQLDDLDEVLKKRLASYEKRIDQVKKAVQAKKIQFLKVLIPLCAVIGNKFGPFGDCRYTLYSDDQSIEVEDSTIEKDARLNLQSFIEEHENHFYRLCNEVIERLKGAFSSITVHEASEVRDLNDLKTRILKVLKP